MGANIMGLSLPQLRRWRAGEPLDHRRLNEPVDVLNDMTRGVGVPRQVTRQGRPAQVGGGQSVLVAMDAGLTDDHLICRAVGSNPESYTPILVAEPWILRRTPFDQQIREDVLYEYENGVKRTAYDNTDPTRQLNRVEQIHPRYLVGDIVIAAPMATGVVVGATPVTLLDINVDSRSWKTYYEWL